MMASAAASVDVVVTLVLLVVTVEFIGDGGAVQSTRRWMAVEIRKDETQQQQ